MASPLLPIATKKKALKNQWEAEVRKTPFDGKLGATLSTKLAVVGLGGMGSTLTGAAVAAAARGASREASLLVAFEKAVMRLWPAFCHIDAQRRPADGGGVGERGRSGRSESEGGPSVC